jgi:rhodanese-related sulfurtransferase
MKRITPKEAKDLLDQGWTYLDVRSESEFEAGHPAGALNIPLLTIGAAGMQPNPDFLQVVEANFPKDSKVVVGCQGGGRSFRAAVLMQGAGYAEVVDQRAGWGGGRDPSGKLEPGWAAEKLPGEQGHPPDRCYQDLSKKVTK